MHILDALRVVNAMFRLIIPRVLIHVFFLAFGIMNGTLHLVRLHTCCIDNNAATVCICTMIVTSSFPISLRPSNAIIRFLYLFDILRSLYPKSKCVPWFRYHGILAARSLYPHTGTSLS